MPNTLHVNVLLVFFGVIFLYVTFRKLPPDGVVSARPTVLPSVALCAVVTDDPDVLEWIDYYDHKGISKIFIYAHNTSAQFEEKVRSHRRVDLVKVTQELYSNTSIQLEVYNDCIRNHRRDVDFLAFFDVDEYLVIVQDNVTLPELMVSFTKIGGLVLNWRGFGSSGLEVRPQEGVKKSYVKCFPEHHSNNWHVKTIANTLYVDKMQTPHNALYREGYSSVNTNFEAQSGPFSNPAVFDRAFINHYGLRSREDYERRLKRAGVDRSRKDWDYFTRVNTEATDDCFTLVGVAQV